MESSHANDVESGQLLPIPDPAESARLLAGLGA
jgi:hypothetical protein